MATKVHKHIGDMDCPSCAKPLPVKEGETGTLIIKCGWCEYINYAVQGTIHHKAVIQKVRLNAPPAAAPAGTGDASSSKTAPARRYAHER